MTPWEALLLVPAGVGAGLTGSVAGLASLVSYPALLAVGLDPIGANVTNTVALVFNSIGSVSASGPELRGRRSEVTRLVAFGLLGGVAGGVLLLFTPSDAFRRLVPWLIAVGSLAVLVPRRTRRGTGRADSRAGIAATTAIGVYGGYFGAAAGVLMLAVYLSVSGEPLPRANALKNVVLGAANGVAALIFAVTAPVHWVAVLPLAVGTFIGGRLGPTVVRHAPTRTLRALIAVAGLGLAVSLAIPAYS